MAHSKLEIHINVKMESRNLDFVVNTGSSTSSVHGSVYQILERLLSSAKIKQLLLVRVKSNPMAPQATIDIEGSNF
ncbi:hypothetical protein TNCV_1225781 [Trichonephila clavipes]|nr:hypothetical protein TNCV_1225781 [Trichonephila clavipes]